ncbi:hypothetical protein QQ020_34750 [Fulvivirgaceae bacterium BMA12]|uniref:Cupin n=1 Tax=Agaribacillus aureus TaxID=3051825 RepID=A0ABT8LHK6_9BACT|nr:hypothetical protein [Fulvivirgaceae bacterium BMA12]
MNLIEKYANRLPGYHPLLISEGWQVAQLNYMEEQDITNIRKIDVHRQTDEVFWLQNGKVALITADLKDDKPTFHAELMQPGILYNIPKNVWHNIAMTPDSEVVIVEKSETHTGDYEFFDLDHRQRQVLQEAVMQVFNKPNLIKSANGNLEK